LHVRNSKRWQVGRRWWFLASVVAGCGRHHAAPQESPKDSLTPPAVAPVTDSGGREILLIGTSLTAGYGLDPSQAWPALVQRKIDSAGWRFRVVDAGVSGESSGDARHRLGWLLSQGTPSIIMVETGANDALRGQPPDSVRANLDAMLDRIAQLDPRPVVVVAGMEALPNLGEAYRERFRAVFPAAARAHGAVYMPFLLTGVAGIDSLNQSDGLHPNAAGSRRVADNVWRTLRPILDSLAHRTQAG
jgi:acyl-CoA thioesterase I